ncbi:MAG: vitamin K epoxide reductase family protein [Planctomycetota bacterium]|jgi:protein-disulfide isomerase/uncharacterized membrane protein
MKKNALNLIAIVLCLVSATICYKLLVKHITGQTGSSWFEAGCSDDPKATGAANCAKVLASRYSYFPAKPETVEGQPTPPAPRVPTAFLGLVYYAALGVWLIGIGTPSLERRHLHLAPMTMVGLGLLVSAYYTMIMFRVLDEWCTWCLVTHVINVVIAVLVFMLRPRATKVDPSPDRPPVHPGNRTFAATLVALFMTAYGLTQMLGLKNMVQRAIRLDEGLTQYKNVIKSLSDDTARLVRSWQVTAPHKFPRQADDIVKSSVPDDTFAWTVVLFSDFECPQCKATAARLEQDIRPMFAGRLRIVFKHFPLHSSCNPETKSTMHPQACQAVSLAEAARALAGTDGFWKAHDYLFEHQDKLKAGKITVDELATHLGVAAESMESASANPEIMEKIRREAKEGRSAGVRSTPAVYLQGRLLHPLANQDLRFWNKIADRFWKAAKEPRPANTKRENLTGPLEGF